VRKLVGALCAAALLAACSANAQGERQIARDGAWGCRDRQDTVDLLFLGISAAFDTKLAHEIALGLCGYFKAGENVVVVDKDPLGLVKVRRTASPGVPLWTPSQNLK
jgi:hypothetical protein